MSNKQYTWCLSIKLWITIKNNCSSLYYLGGISRASLIDNIWKCIPNVKMGFLVWQLYGFRKGLDLLNRVTSVLLFVCNRFICEAYKVASHAMFSNILNVITSLTSSYVQTSQCTPFNLPSHHFLFSFVPPMFYSSLNRSQPPVQWHFSTSLFL